VPRAIFIVVIAGLAVHAGGQTADPAHATLDAAYTALRAKDYDRAIAEFNRAIAVAPARPSIHKDLAYVLLKTGESEAARDQFAEALRLDPGDDRTALEYAFLCYETKQPLIARRIFDRLRKTNATAAEAFENIDRALREGIERWSKAVEISPDNFSAQEELARLFEQRDQPEAAAEHYERAWKLRPDRRALLLDLGRVWKQENREEDAMAALLAASRGAEPRVSEEARELLPQRYPYVYEFEKALELDRANVALRRELAYLHVEMSNRAEALRQFEIVVRLAPDDAESGAQLKMLRAMPSGAGNSTDRESKPELHGTEPGSAPATKPGTKVGSGPESRPDGDALLTDPKTMGLKSFEKGYLKDALKYLQIAHENDPLDFAVMLKLGWTYNMLKDDDAAIQWFALARSSPDPATASEAATAYRNLHGALERFQTTVWAAPTFSTRWHDLFAYAQAKTELRLPHWYVRPYLSVRFIGDSSGAVNVANLGPQYLSERSVIAAMGVATIPWHGATAWFEAGESFRYSPSASDAGVLVPDYRGGVSFSKGFGGLLARGGHGLFAETNDDGIYVSRFGKDTLLYSQNRTGYTLRSIEGVGGVHAQFYWNWNVTADAQGQYWANYVETGPGVRFGFENWRVPVQFSVNAVRGAYLINTGNPRRPNFNDVRVGIWYAFSR
jgi:tetratricopeptide (TPR) repeat protein